MLEQTIMLDEIRESFSVLQNYIRLRANLIRAMQMWTQKIS